MIRFVYLLAVLLGGFASPVVWSQANGVGVVLLHAKGSAPDTRNMRALASALESRGHLVSAPEMAWSRSRMYDATHDEAMSEIDRAVDALRQKGAVKIVVAGQSMGANAALGYAATRNGADGVIAMAPGHTPELGKTRRNAATDVQRARDLIEFGDGKEKQAFSDTNQGKRSAVSATAEVYLSWFDPDGPAVMPKSAAAFKKPLPLLMIVGSREPLAKGQDYIFDKAPLHPGSQFKVVDTDHNGVPGAATDEILSWLEALQGH
ncbi:MAG: hypothetical protein B7X93_12060 [Hydrogenophilales bacterium 17-61-9]|nr:MAG: hypothetical protein B7X93_12060 [Hydrogenophilales bacterium 17-61-9]